MLGGFMGVGAPGRIIDALVARGAPERRVLLPFTGEVGWRTRRERPHGKA